ncbi:molybdopterin molybdotransferase MoeA [Pyrofollis japonicus]|uniref:molybdopterin molybdotransferase MoeA n=1 Tax=Pyrofollis japonicus TaxID=3060460 RepID=UPI00295B3BB7|nr:molybdopterin molybdotransferase MoeA [Pyrofollis japonicus]BEP17868.1 molybdopterin molybdotransferase MoeA [Pyrofollis japonicus]
MEAGEEKRVPRYLEKLTPVKEAIDIIRKRVKPVEDTVVLPVWEAVGRVLAEDLRSPHDFPPRPRAAYDGYAVRSEDTPGKLKVIGEAPIGKVEIEYRVEPGTAVYVSTGAYLPDGADTVVPEEAVRLEDGYIVIDKKFEAGKNIDPVGFYARRGQVLLPKGYVLTELDVVGLLDIAVTRAKVFREIRVGIIATGTELFEPSSPEEAEKRILRGEVAETTAKLIENMIARYTPWARVVKRVLLPDYIDTIEWYIKRQMNNLDLVIMTGGTGPSEVDPFYKLADRLGAEVLFRGLFVRGGRPTSAALLPNGTLLLALSGHPVSALHGFLRLLYHVLKHMGNVERAGEPPIPAYAALAQPLKSKRPEPIKAKLYWRDGVLVAEPLPRERQLSSVTVSNVEADGILLVDKNEYDAGDLVPVMVYREPIELPKEGKREEAEE